MATFTLSPTAPALQAYYTRLENYRRQGTSNETGLRQAFSVLLEEVAANVAWTLILERNFTRQARPDGTLLDNLRIPRGYWEAKDTKDNLETEITQKIAVGYPTFNTIFENSEYGILYQDGQRVLEVDLRHKEQLAMLLSRFFTYTGADLQKFQTAVREFQERIPRLAQGLIHRIAEEFKQNVAFGQAFQKFHALCQQTLHKETSREVIAEMLVQHLLTERLFRTVFDNPDFVRRNGIAAEIEKVIEALTNRAFKRSDFLGELNQIYLTLEENAKRIEDFSAKQAFLNVVYERFLQGFSVKQADTHGIIYTPQPIVDFMWNSVETILQHEFNLPLAAPTVQILDPCVGTGNFILNLLKRISRQDLQRKYENEIFCNEVLLLPYYVAALNIEHCYFELMNSYVAYPGLRLVDTLNSSEVHGERGQTEPAPLTVIIGNPPYNVGQISENDNNKNRKSAVIDRRIRETYAKASRATNKNALSDAYIKFFRWAVDRLEDRDGIICFVSNNGFLDGIAFDGFRQHLLQDFTQVYHLDLHGNVRKNPKLSGTTHNVFGIQVGVGITLAIRKRCKPTKTFHYLRVPEAWRKEEKFAFLTKSGDVRNIAWQVLQPDAKNNWLTEGLFVDFAAFLPLGTKEAKASKNMVVETIFKTYSMGVGTSRDAWMYDFAAHSLAQKAHSMIETYNTELARWLQAGCPSEIDEFVLADAKKIKWSSRLKECFARKIQASFAPQALRRSLYRPFTPQYLYFDEVMTHRRAIFPKIFPTAASETENLALCLSTFSTSKNFHCLITNAISDFHLTGDTQCFPLYTYAEDGSKRKENITAWAVKQFEAQYGPLEATALAVDPPAKAGDSWFDPKDLQQYGLLESTALAVDPPAKAGDSWFDPKGLQQYGPLESTALAVDPPAKAGDSWFDPKGLQQHGLLEATALAVDPPAKAGDSWFNPKGLQQHGPLESTASAVDPTAKAVDSSFNSKGIQVDSTKKAIFFYVYALLHHPLYRERYKENLKRELPRLPLVGDRQTFLTLVDIGQKLADLHLNYETVEEYPLEWVENQKFPWTWRVEKMKLTKEKDTIIVNPCLTLKGLPASAFEYQLGNRSALEWIIDQYQITTDKRSGITNDPNRADEPQYIVRLIGKVLTVSVETVKLVERLREVSL